MKYLRITCVFILLACLIAVGQVNQIWYKKGKVLYTVPVAGIDSVTYGQFLSADTFFIVIDRASRRIVYDTINEHVPGMVFHDTIHTTHTVHLNPGRRIGVFSVAKDKQVSFSQGNLQYIQNQNIWKFADQQYEYIGAGNIKDGKLANKIDLFGWSTDNPVTPWGIKNTSNSNFIGQFVDWGKNCIHNSEANIWRTLSNDEWKYLFQLRMDAANLYAFVSIDTINGIIILPDNWQPIDTISLKMGNNEFDTNKLSWTQWTTLEANDAVFLPAAGVLMGTKHNHTTSGLYWSSTADSENDINAYSLYFPKRYIHFDYTHQRSTKRSVRLVYDTIVPPPAPEYVDLGLSVKWATFNVGAMAPEEYGDYFAWGETEPKTEYSWKNYKWCDGTASSLTKYCSDSNYGNVDNKTTLDLEDDAAHVNWGGDWRIPSAEEWAELRTQCQWTLTERHGVSGYEVKSKVNGNTIFIPIGGFFSGKNLVYDYLGGYWSTTLNESKQSCALGLYLNETENRVGQYFNSSRLNGFSIRAVYDDIPDPCQVVRVNDTLSINMMCVEGGTFMMGAMDGDTLARNAEKPAHLVTLNYDYSIMQTEVTQEMWEAVMGEDIYDLIAESPYPDSKPISTKGNFPVGYVRLKQCLEFIDSLNARTGLHFRMPTEAEWEYAARGGHRSKGFLYSGSDDMSDVAHINYGVVAKLRPNELGIYDMSGNMAEMTLDYLVDHETGYPSAEAQVNPRRISSSGNRAVRGLKRFSSYVNLRISHRSAYTPSWCGSGMGFRLVLPEERDFHTIYVNGVFFDMAFVEGGTFMMGDNSSDNASPAHQVTLSDYYIGQTEVTQALWTAVMGTNPSKFRGNNLPVECVSWEDCQLFVQKLSEMTGLHFRLPTEAEWEFAARGGVKSRGYVYAGSDDVDSVAWYGSNSGQKTHSIAGKKPNELGIYDMSGNVWEWCQDWHEPYTAESQENPQGASEGEKPVIRGGCWHYNPMQCTPTYRYSYYKRTGSGSSTGFRIVLDIK